MRAFKVTQFNDSSQDDERKKAQKATKPAFGLGNVSGRAETFKLLHYLIISTTYYICWMLLYQN